MNCTVDWRWVIGVGSFGGVPEDAVEFVFGGEVVFAEVHSLGFGGEWRIFCILREHVHLRHDRRVGRRDGVGLKGVEHGCGASVVLGHGREAEDQFHCADHASGRIHGAVDKVALAPGADDEADGAMGVDVVGAVLRVVFDDEDGHLIPKSAAAGGFDDAAKTEIVARDAGFRREGAGFGSGGVVFAKGHDGERG